MEGVGQVVWYKTVSLREPVNVNVDSKGVSKVEGVIVSDTLNVAGRVCVNEGCASCARVVVRIIVRNRLAQKCYWETLPAGSTRDSRIRCRQRYGEMCTVCEQLSVGDVVTDVTHFGIVSSTGVMSDQSGQSLLNGNSIELYTAFTCVCAVASG
jgi:hypothetical protein